MLKNTKVTVWSNFVPQCECWDSVNPTQRGPWHSWEEVSKSPPAHCSTSFAFLTCSRKFWYTLLKHHLLHIHPWRNKTDQTNVLPLPSLPSDVPGAHLGTLCFQEFLLCTSTAPQPNWCEWSQVLLRWGATVPGTKSPKPPALGSHVIGRALLSKARAAGAPSSGSPHSMQQSNHMFLIP